MTAAGTNGAAIQKLVATGERGPDTVANNIAITDAGATSRRQIPTPHPRKGRHPAQRTEDPRKPRKPCRE